MNGVWKALPAVGPSASAPVASDWGATWVPGSWFGGFDKKGSGVEWATQGPTLQKAWYERQIEVPASWKGRKVIVDFRRVSTDTTVSVNGKECGFVPWPYGQVDITSAVTPGSTAELRVLVSASTTPGEHVLPMGPAEVQMTKVQNKLSSAGLIGEVFLLSEPAGPSMTDVFAQPSVRKKELTLAVEVTGLNQNETAACTATILNASGQKEQVFQKSVSLRAEPVQRVELTFPWTNPALWTPEHPNLYTVQLKVDGSSIHDVYPQRFGFREFWVEGKKFFLNGQEIRLRPNVFAPNDAPHTLAGCDGYIEHVKAAGFNIVEQQTQNLDERGWSSQHWEVFCERADEKGLMVIANAMDFGNYLTQDKKITWWDPGVKEHYQARAEADSRHYRNSPSVVMWTTTANRYGQFQDQNPRTIGVREIEFPLKPFQLQDIHNKAGLDAINVLHTVDPTRPVYSHAGDMVGDVYTINNYLNLIPLQEREEWLSNYAQKGDMPYMAVEFGLPLAQPTMQRGRGGYGNSTMSEPLATEFCAIYLGPDSYRLEPADYRGEIVSKFDGKHSWASFHNDTVLTQEPAIQQLTTLFIRNTWRAWRTSGITGGMIPWDLASQVFKRTKTGVDAPSAPFQPGLRDSYRPNSQERAAHYLDVGNGWEATAASRALEESNGPTLAWIAGAPENFYEKAHSFRSGQKVSKQICLINDLPAAAPYHVTWKVVVGGTPLHQDTAEGTIAVASNLFLPIAIPLPSAVPGEKVDGEIDLEATIGGRVSTDKFLFRVFNRDTGAMPQAFVYDPEGKTSGLLKQLGVDVAPWTDMAPSGSRPLLVVGRDALSSGKPAPGDLQKFVSDGGRLLVMAQDPAWMSKVPGFRVNRQVSRRVFPVMGDHPITAGLNATDLCNWAGAGTLIEARPTYDLNSFSDYGWHWSNQGSVSCASVEKPHFSGWTPILQGEFDLAYSPLMQLDYGKGSAILCMLDLEDQAPVDPVAELLARRIVQQTALSKPRPRRPVVLLGGDADAALLKSMGVVFDRAVALPGPGTLAIIGTGTTVTSDQIDGFARQGGNVLLLASPAGQNALGLPISSKAGFFGVAEFESSCKTPLAGLGVSDLHFRTGTTWPVLEKGGISETGGLISAQTVGSGTVVACQLDPRLLNADRTFYFRLTRWRQTRVLSQLLANLGASFAGDVNLFTAGAKAPLYHPDYIRSVQDGDDPGRYYRW